MDRPFSGLQLFCSMVFSCLVLSSVLIPLQTTAVIPQTFVAQQSNKLPSAKAIAEQVRKDAIAKDRLEKTARVVQVERVRKEVWMYNPVPYWKITIADARQKLLYFTNESGTFRRLMQLPSRARAEI
jgi:hypothetical protein